MTPIKMQGANLASEKQMQILQGSNTGTFNTKKGGEQGSILLLFLPWIVILFFLVSGFSWLSIHVQSAIALESRLDVCALDIAHSRIHLFNYLSDTNSVLQKIQIALEAIRGTKIIPVVGEFGSMAEPALLELAQSIKLSQDAMVVNEEIEESEKVACQKNKFSESMASCPFHPIDPTQLEREQALFPDIPGRISLIGKNATLLRVRCLGMYSLKTYISQIAVRGDPNLFQRNFYYAYE